MVSDVPDDVLQRGRGNVFVVADLHYPDGADGTITETEEAEPT